MRKPEKLVRKSLRRSFLGCGSPPRGRHCALFVAGLAAALLTGCAERSLDNAYKTYLKRLATTLDVPAEGVATTQAPRYPRTGQLQLALEGTSLDTLDFLALSGCAVQVTIGKRNSSLGRFARPSQRLLLELEYLRLAPECAAHLRQKNKSALANTLTGAWEAKHAQLPALIFNATLASEEFRALWRANPVPGEFPAVQSSQVIEALDQINHLAERWLSGDFQADNTRFELLLSEVAGGDGGAVLQALARQNDWLNEANRMLHNRAQRGPLCAPGVRHAAADILPAVVRKFFVGGIQPAAAQMERRMYALLPPVEKLETTLRNVQPESYRRWQTQRDALLLEVRHAPANHVAAVQKNLENCDITPQA